MNFGHKYLLLILLGTSFLFGVEKRPNPHLQSSTITWWSTFPLHTTLSYFSNNERTRYPLDEAFKTFKKSDSTISQEVPLLMLLDVVTGAKVLPNEFLLETSAQEPGGMEEKFHKIFHSKKPSQKKPWYLVLKMSDSITRLQNDLIKTWFDPFKQSSFFYLPHITIGKITNINNAHLFLKTMQNANKELLKQKNAAIVFDKNHIVLKHPKIFHGAQFQNSILMLTIHRKEPAEQLAFNIVRYFPQAEHDAMLEIKLM